MRIVPICALLALTSCATAPPPIVDMAGKDPIQVNRDMAECREHPYDHVSFTGTDQSHILPQGFPQSRCLESMGYTVLSRTQ